jgi:hypothetical protein
MENIERFIEEYRRQLPVAVAKYVDDYPWAKPGAPGALTTDIVADRMAAAIRKGSYNHNSHAFRLTCKALGFKHTKTAIEQFIGRR